MIITFCGHSNYSSNLEDEERLLKFLEKVVCENQVDFYLGGYGNFDSFAYECCKKYKETHPKVSLVFVTPYLTVEYQKNHLEYQKTRYDEIVYPDIEDKPPRFAIIYRNRYMVDKADYVVAYVSHDWGGAYTTYKYAQRKGKKIFNLADFEK